jgi:thioredoxin 2
VSIVVCPVCGARNRVPSAASGTPRCAKCKEHLPWIVDAGDDDFDAAVRAAMPVLVDFWAPWCGPCRLVSPAVEAAGSGLAGRLKVVKVNVDEAQQVAARHGIQSIPTLVLFRSGHPVARQVGALSAAALSSWVRTQLEARPSA